MNFFLLRRRALPALAAATLLISGCDDDPAGPMTGPMATDVSAVDFGALDTNFGPGVAQTFTVTNVSNVALTVGPMNVLGDEDFNLSYGAEATSLAPGASMDVAVTFDPAREGDRSAQVVVPADGREGAVVFVSGRGRAFQYRQVDRMGIPGLNTVFNHPPVFSKTAYNVATPDRDVADYSGLFETVLGAVGNADPSATAALLLPDALPVSLAGATAFATLTGRALTDDAVDVALSVTVGDPALQSDNVDLNDKAFLMDFPYLAAPHR